jgi:ABC-type nitrate/sulfonate/bicarbonate transport system ATPase subunit
MTRRILQVKGLTVSFSAGRDRMRILSNLHLEAAQGECLALIGPSGCGKSTLFNVLAGLIESESGDIFLYGCKTPDIRNKIAYMQQKDLLLPWRTVLDNAILSLEIKGMSRKKARLKAKSLLPEFGLVGFEHRFPDEISGGMRKRLAMLRTVLADREILLLDEPFVSLDAITRREMQKWLLKIKDKYSPTILLVTHDVEEALILADRIYVLSHRPAGIEAEINAPCSGLDSTANPEFNRIKAVILELLERGVGVAR